MRIPHVRFIYKPNAFLMFWRASFWASSLPAGRPASRPGIWLNFPEEAQTFFTAQWKKVSHVVDVFALSRKSKFNEIRNTFWKLQILDISIRVPLRLKTQIGQKHYVLHWKCSKKVSKSHSQDVAPKYKGGFWVPLPAIPPILRRPENVWFCWPKGGGVLSNCR